MAAPIRTLASTATANGELACFCHRHRLERYESGSPLFLGLGHASPIVLANSRMGVTFYFCSSFIPFMLTVFKISVKKSGSVSSSSFPRSFCKLRPPRCAVPRRSHVIASGPSFLALASSRLHKGTYIKDIVPFVSFFPDDVFLDLASVGRLYRTPSVSN